MLGKMLEKVIGTDVFGEGLNCLNTEKKASTPQSCQFIP
jgi:hypothetical protein